VTAEVEGWETNGNGTATSGTAARVTSWCGNSSTMRETRLDTAGIVVGAQRGKRSNIGQSCHPQLVSAYISVRAANSSHTLEPVMLASKVRFGASWKEAVGRRCLPLDRAATRTGSDKRRIKAAPVDGATSPRRGISVARMSWCAGGLVNRWVSDCAHAL